ncbi:hypothetical protein [Maribacter sp. 2304DJ31-5]|uniref:hypothetical protein n=1 Tax=Maribacter sp. 2304DJ31-5 TaxID=3386273 RepID=UPI0039BD4D17
MNKNHLKTAIYFIIPLLYFTSCSKEKKCSDYKVGRFNYVLENRPELIIRNDSIQIEINPITKLEVHSSLEWISECEYIMTYETILNYPEDVSGLIGQEINVEILETTHNGYRVRATSSVIDDILEFRVSDK